MRIRIAFFSRNGHTDRVAVTLARLLGAELVRIVPLREYGVPGTLLKTFFYKIGSVETGMNRVFAPKP